MGSIGASEILVILVVALLVLGPERLPEAARQVGRFLGEIRRIGGGLQAELRDVMDAPSQVMNPQATASSQPASPSATAPPGPSAGVDPAMPPPGARPTDLDGDPTP